MTAPDKRRDIVLKLADRGDVFMIDAESFDELILHAFDSLSDTKRTIEETPIDWDSPNVRDQFETILDELSMIRGLIDDAGMFREWIRNPLKREPS